MMTDNELLLAISKIMDKKIDPLAADIQEVKDKINILDGRVASLEEKFDILDRRVANLEEKFDILDRRVASLEANFAILDDRVASLEASMSEVQKTTNGLKRTNETQILPRLNEIESCYLSTYQSYQKGVNKIESLWSDNEIIKTVLIEHSEKLQALA